MAKKHNRTDTEDRSFAYRDARWNLNFGAVQDVDHIEYKIVNGEVVYVAVLELTLRETPKNLRNPPSSYFERVKKRYLTGSQGKFTIQTAKRLGVDAFIVVFNEDATRFWVYNMSKNYGFNREINQKQYFDWLKSLHHPDLISNIK